MWKACPETPPWTIMHLQCTCKAKCSHLGFQFFVYFHMVTVWPCHRGQEKTQCKSSKNNRGVNDGYVFGKVKEVTQFQTPSRKDQSFAFCQTGLGLNYCHNAYSYS